MKKNIRYSLLLFFIMLSSQTRAATIYKCGKQKIPAILSKYYIDGHIPKALLKLKQSKDIINGLFLTLDYGSLSQHSIEVKVGSNLMSKFKKFAREDKFQGMITVDISDGGMKPEKVQVLDIEAALLDKQLREPTEVIMLEPRVCPESE